MNPISSTLDATDMSLAYPVPSAKGNLANMTACRTDNGNVRGLQLCASIGFPLSQWPNTTLAVYSMRDGLDVSRTHTGPVAAKMIGLQTLRNWSDKAFISPTVSTNQVLSISETPIPIASHSRPFPTTAIENSHLRPEAGRQSGIAEKGRGAKMGLHREHSILGAMQPEVICLAAAFIIPEGGASFHLRQ